MSNSLRVFVSSRMQELAPERQAVEAALDDLGVDAWLYEEDAGARPETIEQVFLEEVAAADLYIGIFWKGYGAYTIDEFEHARNLGKPCLIYEKRAGIEGQRDPKLQAFLDRISRVETGLAVGWFDTTDELGELVKRDVARELAEVYRRHRDDRLAHTLPPAAAEERRNLLILLDKVKQTWVEGVLEKATLGKVLLDVNKTMRPDAVAQPWEEVLGSDEPISETVPPGTTIINLFEASGRALLILGAPGSGKTIALLDLAHALLTRAKRDATLPIPVVFNLSAWSDTGQDLATWLTAELSDKYRIPKKMGRAWLDAHRLLLLLDGLDEVRPEKRAACVEAINAFARESLHGLVVCSRLEEYEALRPARLELDRAVCLEPLTPAQVDTYLTGAAADLDALRATLDADPTLQILAETPLMLNIMSEVYEDALAETLTPVENAPPEARRRHLLDTYVARMFKRRGAAAPFSREQTTAWLAWLAQGMDQHTQSVFLIEDLQPSWLKTQGQRWAYALGENLIGWLLYGLIIGPAFGLLAWNFSESTPQELPILVLAGLIWGFLGGFFFGLISGLFNGFRDRQQRLQSDIKPTEALNWSWTGALMGIVWGLILGQLTGVIYWLIDGMSTATEDIVLYLISGLILGLIVGMASAFREALKSRIVEAKTLPNQGIKLSIRNAVLAGMGSGLGVGSSTGLIMGLLSGTEENIFGILRDGLIPGLSLGLIIGLLISSQFGGIAVIKHYTLRLVLIRSGVIPRDLVGFLDYAARLIFLQKVGGGYIFIHRLMLEHFAALRPPRDQNKARPSEKT